MGKERMQAILNDRTYHPGRYYETLLG